MPYMDDVLTELIAAKGKHPSWPVDPIHAAAILGEEYGELTKALVECIYEYPRSTVGEVRSEAVQVAAMALRWLENFDMYEFGEGERR